MEGGGGTSKPLWILIAESMSESPLVILRTIRIPSIHSHFCYQILNVRIPQVQYVNLSESLSVYVGRSEFFIRILKVDPPWSTTLIGALNETALIFIVFIAYWSNKILFTSMSL